MVTEPTLLTCLWETRRASGRRQCQGVQESHRAGEGRNGVGDPPLDRGRPPLGHGQKGRVLRFAELGVGHLQVPLIAREC